jgi:hypothetical protein
MTEEKKPLKVVFAPGCFDGFEGTQEELDELVSEINRMVESGEIFEKSNPLNPEDISDDQRELLEQVMEAIENDKDLPSRKYLN